MEIQLPNIDLHLQTSKAFDLCNLAAPRVVFLNWLENRHTSHTISITLAQKYIGSKETVQELF